MFKKLIPVIAIFLIISNCFLICTILYQKIVLEEIFNINTLQREKITRYRNMNQQLLHEIKLLKQKNIPEIQPQEKKLTTNVRVSWYNPEDPNQTDDSPNICAWGYEVKPGDKIVAVSRDLLNNGFLKKGDRVIIGKYGEFTVRDKMNSRYKLSVDIAITNPELTSLEERKKLAKVNGISYQLLTRL